ncbi:MAG: hypothetical protein Q8K65_03335, partial [Alphaproteobacteria bacterium]|nr:hypothetical protein [Alphaproteobacteria bacterium]
GTLGMEGELYERYQLLSKIFGYSSYVVMAAGCLLIYFSIQRMNQEYREKLNHNNKSEKKKNF